MRFAIDAEPVPARRFRLPVDEHATAPPAPLPEDKPVTAPVWGAGAARETRKRPVEAQTPRRPVEAQMGAGGLLTVLKPRSGLGRAGKSWNSRRPANTKWPGSWERSSSESTGTA